MSSNLGTFYRRFYVSTNGYIPSNPITNFVLPGDFFQIKNGRMIRLGNFYKEGFVKGEEVRLSEKGVPLTNYSWKMSQGFKKEHAVREVINNDYGEKAYNFTKQLLRYVNPGSFSFSAHKPEAVRILNWDYIKDKLLVKFTQSAYSFRDLFIVTEVVSAEHWTLAVSGQHNAELEVISAENHIGLVDIFGDSSSQAIESKGMEVYTSREGRIPNFFKAKKLILREEISDAYFQSISENEEEMVDWAKDFYDYEFQTNDQFSLPQLGQHIVWDLVDVIISTQLNINNALQHFKWVDASMDDVAKFNLHYDE